MLSNNKGFTLLELLITLVISAILMTVFVELYSASVKKYNTASNRERLDQSLQASMRLMANDIRRAGFWGNAISALHTGINSNPFNASDVAITGGTCILLSYDQNGDGSMPAVGVGSDDERYGYRLMNSTIQARPSGASFSCAAIASAWATITDVNVVQITTLSFVETDRVVVIASPATPTMTVRSVVITLTGRLTSDNSVTKTLTEQVKIANDKYAP